MSNPLEKIRNALNTSRASRWDRSVTEQRSLDEGLRPTSLDGWVNGTPLVRPLGGSPINIGRSVTNGAIAPGAVCCDYAQGVPQIDGVPYITGVIPGLDSEEGLGADTSAPGRQDGFLEPDEPSNPGGCLPGQSASPSHVEVFLSYSSYGYSIAVANGVIYDTSESSVTDKVLYRVFFRTSLNLDLFNGQQDYFAPGAQPFQCPQSCEVTGGCFELRLVSEQIFDGATGYAGYLRQYALFLNLKGACYEIFGFGQSQVDLVAQGGDGFYLVSGYYKASINYRLIYNSQ